MEKEVLKDVYTFIKTTLIDVLGVEIVVEKQIKNLTTELLELLKEINIEKPSEFNEENLTVELIFMSYRLCKNAINKILHFRVR